MKKIYIKGKKTKLSADKSMKAIVCTVKGAKAIRGAKKTHMTYRSKRGKWIKHVKNVPTK
ncbi:MAG: hypothetical protein MSS65_02780 [Clostridium sp.]|nr:hypothetical protein [Clostridium sp.]